MSYIIELTHTPGATVYAYPSSEGSFTNWVSRRILASEASGRYRATVDADTYGPIWYFFEGASTPASYDDNIGSADVNQYQNSVDVLPGYVTQQKATQLNELIVQCGSKALQSITCYNSDGTSQSLSGRTLEVVVSEPNNDTDDADGQTVIDTIANANITVSGTDNNVATWRYTALMVSKPRVLLWALRDVTTANDFELQGGTLNVRLTAVDL